MKQINQDELYQHIGDFLKTKGIEFKEGSYTKRIHQGCNLLTDAINLTQEGIEKAKTSIDKKLGQMRQVIHEKTAPKPSFSPRTSATPTAKSQGATAKATAKKTSASRKRRPKKARK